jgi:hypothetical protein
MNGNVRDHVLREMRMEIRDLADEGMSAEEIDRHLNGHRTLTEAEQGMIDLLTYHTIAEVRGQYWGMQLEKSSVKILLGQRVTEGVDDSRALAASVLFRMPPELRDAGVREFLGWIQGSNGPLVSEYMRAATIRPDARLSELSSFQRAALIGELRVRRRIVR